MAQYASYTGYTGGGGGGGSGITSINSQTGPGLAISAGTGISVASGANVITITNTAASGATPQLEYRTLSSGESAAKQLTLANVPANAAMVILDVIDGGPQQYSVDYSVSVDVVSWSGLGLDGILSTGDVLRLLYFT